MFGMIDYRAHKLWWLLTVIPFFLIKLISFFGVPFISYYLGFSNFNEWWSIALAVIFIHIIAEALFGAIVFAFDFVAKRVFVFFIDVIPADGRNETQANAVLLNGDKAIKSIELTSKNPALFTDDDINFLSGLERSWFQSSKAKERLLALKNYYLENPGKDYDDDGLMNANSELGLNRSWVEIAGHPQFRKYWIAYAILIAYSLLNPLKL